MFIKRLESEKHDLYVARTGTMQDLVCIKLIYFYNYIFIGRT